MTVPAQARISTIKGKWNGSAQNGSYIQDMDSGKPSNSDVRLNPDHIDPNS